MDAAAKWIRFAWLLPLVALALGYAGGVARRGAPATRSDDARSIDAPTRDATRAASPVVVAPARLLPDMPVERAPLAGSFDALAVRARGGDDRAAVRLLEETSRCRARPREAALLGEPDNATPALADKEIDAWLREYMVRRRERARIEYAESESLCADVTAAQLSTAPEWLERAASSGDAGSALCYAMLGTSDEFLPPRFSDAWIESMRRYREQAVPYAEHAFAAGFAQAAWFLSDAYAGNYGILFHSVSPATAPDFPRAYAMLLLQAKRVPPEDLAPGDVQSIRVRARQIEAELTSRDIARARQWADSESAKALAGPRPSLPCGDLDLP